MAFFVIFVLFLFRRPSAVAIEISTNISDIHFWLYPNPNDPEYKEELILGDVASLKSLKPGRLTVFLAHGFWASPDSYGPKEIRKAYLTSPFDGNYIAVDWSKLVGHTIYIDLPVIYTIAVSNVPKVSSVVIKLIQWLVALGHVSIEKTHLIGHSLGAHTMGQVGYQTQKLWSGQRFPRITGLDPAKPLFFPVIEGRNLNRNDADFVDVIHTNTGLSGDKTWDGHVDFYPNGGTFQPGCGFYDLACSHSYSMLLYAKSFNELFIACQCSHPAVEHCNFDFGCRNPVAVGVYCPTTARGVYAAKTPKIPIPSNQTQN